MNILLIKLNYMKQHITKEQLWEVLFSDGHNKSREILYNIRAQNRNEAYNKARIKLEEDYIIDGSPYFFITPLGSS